MNASPNPGLLVVFAKWPEAGSVKTRMTPPLSPEQAAKLYACMLDDVLAESARAADALGLEAVVALHPGERACELAAGIPEAFRVVPQRGAGLAQRMAGAVAEAFAQGAERVLIRGSDNPGLSSAAIATLYRALDEVDLVLGPDLDGGYGIVGLRRPAPGLFDHPMSTESVLHDTQANAARLGLCCRVGEPSFDIDRFDDLNRLREFAAELETSAAQQLCGRTLACLDEMEESRR